MNWLTTPIVLDNLRSEKKTTFMSTTSQLTKVLDIRQSYLGDFHLGTLLCTVLWAFVHSVTSIMLLLRLHVLYSSGVLLR